MRRFLSALLAALILPAVAGHALAAPPPAEGDAREFSIGDMKAVALKDGALESANDGKDFIVGHSAAEVAAVLASGGAPTDHFELSIQPLLVRVDKRVLLFDAGAGSYFGPIAGALPKSLLKVGIAPDKVSDIFISHVHGDHIGGLLTPAGALAFPNAAIHMSAPEWTYLKTMSPHLAKLVGITNWDTLVKTIKPKVVPFAPDAQIIPDVVKAVAIKGHTPGHSGYLIGSDGDTLLYIGDSMHSYVVSVGKPEWHTAFDNDPDTAAASRVALVTHAAETGQRIFAVHFPFPGVGKIVKKSDGSTWVPESPLD